MNQLTRQEVEGVIERLVDRTLSFGCLVLDKTTRKTSRLSRITNSGDAVVVGHVTGIFTPVSFSNEFIVLGHHITIGDVLEKIVSMHNEYTLYSSEDDYGYIEELVQLWQPLGLSKSLQEIMSDSGWEEIWECGCVGSHLKNGARGIPLKHISQKHPSKKMEVLKSPEANALFSFLIEIGL